jgi:hypothetical protein
MNEKIRVTYVVDCMIAVWCHRSKVKIVAFLNVVGPRARLRKGDNVPTFGWNALHLISVTWTLDSRLLIGISSDSDAGEFQ